MDRINGNAEINTELSLNCSINTSNLVPLPINITINSPITNEILGVFKEKDGLLTFKGKVDEAGKIFVDFICETFKQRIEHLSRELIKSE